jgi:hypothetical protein
MDDKSKLKTFMLIADALAAEQRAIIANSVSYGFRAFTQKM